MTARPGDDDVGPIVAEAGDFAALLDREFSQAVDEMSQLGAGNLAAGHRKPRLAFGGHHHVGQGCKRAAGADEQVRRDGNFVGIFSEMLVDPLEHSIVIVAGHRLAAAKFLGQSDRAEVGGVDRFDLFTRGEDHFGAASADVG